MKIGSVLNHKGSYVATIEPKKKVSKLLDIMSEKNIGAVVVTKDGKQIEGIVSERDVVRGTQKIGKKLLKLPVSMIMTDVIASCTVDSTVEELMIMMTDKRVRHVPVLDDESNLIGIVSIGDVVYARIESLEDEKKNLVDYITS